MTSIPRGLALTLLLAALPFAEAYAQDSTLQLPAPPPAATPPGAVIREDLSPVLATDGSGLPFELWRGLDVAAVEGLIAELKLPPRSPALHGLWRRLITSDVTPPAGGESNTHFAALRLEGLYRSGLLKEFSAELAKAPNAADPLIAALSARAEIGEGRADTGCDKAKALPAVKTEMPKSLRREALLITGYCAAKSGNMAAAGLAAELAREEGIDQSAGLDALDLIAIGGKPKPDPKKSLSLLDYRILEVAGATQPDNLTQRADASLLAVLSDDDNTAPDLKLRAGEAAARLNAIPPDALATLYRTEPGQPSADALLSSTTKTNPPGHRAALFKAAETERTPLKKVRLVRTFLDDARRAGLYLPALQMIAPATQSIAPVPEIGWFSETVIEIMLAAGDTQRARDWVIFGGGLDRLGGETSPSQQNALAHWLALADIAGPGQSTSRETSLKSVEDMAVRGRFSSDLLHRLATVLDALDTQVPIPLWEAASRTPQPSTGHLPATGVLTELQDASKKKEFGRTVLLAMKTLGPDGAEGAHMIALGDAIRALKRAGLEHDARRLGFEALFAAWPRSANH